MMLRVSSHTTEREFDYHAIAKGNEAGPSGVPHGEALVAFAEAVVARDEPEMAELRSQLRRDMGDRAFGDICGVIANFHRMVRIADGTGIPLDERMMAMTDDLREELGINSFGSARNTVGPKPVDA